MNYLREVFGKKQIILAITGFVSLLLFGLLTLICVRTSNKLTSQHFADRWCTDGSFAQVSAYMSELSGFKEENLEMIVPFLNNRLQTDSIVPKNENARQCIVAYCAEGEAEVSSGKNTVSVKAYGVGGDFFMFHPFDIVYGNYFDGADLMDDMVVIDTTTAWNLFGSPNVVGKVIKVGDREHVISAVVERETGRLNDLAGNDVATIYVSLNSLKEYGTFTYINTIEALLPNPITNYAINILTECLELEEERVSFVENSGRFHWNKLVMNAKNFGIRGMNNKGLVYPYWENVARGTEDILTPVCLLAILFLAYPAFLFIILLFRMWKKRTIHKKDVWNFIQDRIEDYREERRKRLEDGEFD